MPFPFYLTCLALIVSAWFAWSARYSGWGVPACAVLVTVAVWYVVDVLYNDYEEYLMTIGADSVMSAWWQLLWFVIAFGCLVKPIHLLVNSRLPGQRSYLMSYLETNRLRSRATQHQIDLLAAGLLVVWLVLMGIALIAVKGNFIGLFAPYLGHKVNPWSRGQIGGGFSALLSFASYLQVFLAAAFGVLAAVSYNPKTRNLALVVCALTLPFYIFDRSRSVLLATAMPGLLAFVFLRLKGGWMKKGLVLVSCFLLINFWLTVVMANRSGMSFDIKGALSGEKDTAEVKHEGLNMFGELAWIDYFIESGSYLPNGGQRYFAELVNPIPRGLWKDKPMIGLDYAVARGMAAVGPNGEVNATISTGMIGQGVVNFGRFFGPLASAVLISLWVALLARQDLQGNSPGRLILYVTGLLLTFNLGRDITFLVIYPFLFGIILYKVWRIWSGRQTNQGGGERRRTGRVQRPVRSVRNQSIRNG